MKPILFHMENIDCYDVLLSQPTFHLKYICALQKVLHLEDVVKALSQYIFEEGHINSINKTYSIQCCWN